MFWVGVIGGLVDLREGVVVTGRCRPWRKDRSKSGHARAERGLHDASLRG